MPTSNVMYISKHLSSLHKIYVSVEFIHCPLNITFRSTPPNQGAFSFP